MFSAWFGFAESGFRLRFCKSPGSWPGTPAGTHRQQILNPIGVPDASHRKQQITGTMKPTVSTTHRASRREPFDPTIRNRRMSLVANYHSATFETLQANCGRSPVRSFWNITGDYVKNEARHDFLGEAALFAVIVITAFLPLISNAHALMGFVRAIGNF
jgi:hypothetical protein